MNQPSLFDLPQPVGTPSIPRHVLDVGTIYHEPSIEAHARGREILARFPDAERIKVPSHWNIPSLHGNEGYVRDWLKVKRESLVVGVKKGVTFLPYTRSCDWVAPSHSNGCALACAYCVAEGTLISTPRGPVPVEQIRDGEQVLAFDVASGERVAALVNGTTSREADKALEIRVGLQVLVVTAEHPIWTLRGWIEAGALHVGDEVMQLDSGALEFKRIASITPAAGPIRVYNFHVPGPESYIANGIVTHNCYVPRRKGFANPISTFVNIEQIQRAIVRHAQKAGPKTEPTTAGDTHWIYELGCNSDLSLDAAICDNARDLIALFRSLPNAQATFATKFVNRDLLSYDPQRKTRMRFSLMPPRLSRVVDVRTSPIAQRIAAINEFYEAGYEMNLNFSPVIFTPDWEAEWRELFQMIDGSISQAVKAQLKCEVIFLTHNAALHQVNEQWHPRGEEMLWQPEIQESKISEGGMENLRYKRGFKGDLVRRFQEILREEMPYCGVRYAF